MTSVTSTVTRFADRSHALCFSRNSRTNSDCIGAVSRRKPSREKPIGSQSRLDPGIAMYGGNTRSSSLPRPDGCRADVGWFHTGFAPARLPCASIALIDGDRPDPTMHPVSAPCPISRLEPLRTGGFRLDGGGMFGLIPKAMWSQWITPDADNRIALATRSLLVESRDGLVLVEAGCGDKWSDRERAMYDLERRTAVDALAELSVDPREIAHVVLTHLHFDHAAGLTRNGSQDVESVFPGARIHVQRQEWLDALANKSTMTRTYFRSHLDPITTQVELHDGTCSPLSGITLLPTPGHTWGHQSILIDAPGGPVLYAGDACPTTHHAHPAASLGYDMMAYESMLSKREILGRALEQGWRIALDHDPVHAFARVERHADRAVLVGHD